MMNEVTMLLAQLWGPILVVLGIGILVSRSYYVRVYRGLENETLALMIGAVAFMAAGIAQVLAHNTWDSLPEIVISLLGWALLAKGVVLAIFPRAVDRWGDVAARSQYFNIAAAATIILGGYLTALGYL